MRWLRPRAWRDWSPAKPSPHAPSTSPSSTTGSGRGPRSSWRRRGSACFATGSTGRVEGRSTLLPLLLGCCELRRLALLPSLLPAFPVVRPAHPGPGPPPHVQASPSSSPPRASSALRWQAASMAFRNAALTPASSRWRIAAMVVPPGEVTISRSSTGCLPVRQELVGDREVLVFGLGPGRHHRHRLVHEHGDVRHDADHRHIGDEMLLHERGPDAGGEADHQVLRRHVPGHLPQEGLDILGLDREHHGLGPLHGLWVGQGGDHAVSFGQLADSLLATSRDHDLVGVPPTRADQPGHKSLAHLAAAEERDPPSHPPVLRRLISLSSPGSTGRTTYWQVARPGAESGRDTIRRRKGCKPAPGIRPAPGDAGGHAERRTTSGTPSETTARGDVPRTASSPRSAGDRGWPRAHCGPARSAGRSTGRTRHPPPAGSRGRSPAVPGTPPSPAVLLAYAKIALYDALLKSDLPDDPHLAGDLL